MTIVCAKWLLNPYDNDGFAPTLAYNVHHMKYS